MVESKEVVLYARSLLIPASMILANIMSSFFSTLPIAETPILSMKTPITDA
jgi:hypothetical protein